MNAISRRDFAAGLGGITLAFTLAPRLAVAQQPSAQQRLPGSLDTNRLLDAWIRIGTDGNAMVCTGKVELGQGIVTALAQIAAEELDLPLDRVQMISGDTEPLGGELDQDRARLRACHPDRRATRLDRLAAGGLALIGGPAGVA